MRLLQYPQSFKSHKLSFRNDMYTLSFSPAFIFVLLVGLIFDSTCIVAARAPSVSTVYQFSSVGTWAESIAVRPNGQVLVTRLDVPEIWSIDPVSQTAYLVHTFTGATSTIGITAIGPDIYAVGSGIVDLSTYAATPGSFVIWKVDLRGHRPGVSIIKAIPEGGSLSGLTLFRGGGNSTFILIADTVLGKVWRLNPKTGAYSVALSDSTMQPAAGGPPIGINGLRTVGNKLYYTSSTQQVFCRVTLNQDASAAGPFEVVASGSFQDGFDITGDSTAYITTHPQNTVIKVTPSGDSSVYAGNLNSSALAGSTDAHLGTFRGRQVLFVTTNGGLGAPVNGTFTEPAKVVMIKAG